MKISGVDPESGKETQYEASELDRGFIDAMLKFDMTNESINNMIDNLSVSADIKSLLYAVSKATIKAGATIIKIGRKIIDFICKLYSEFPGASFGMIFGAIAGFLISTIPIIGVVLGPVVTPVLMGLGMVLGLHQDIKDKALVRKITEINAKFGAFA